MRSRLGTLLGAVCTLGASIGCLPPPLPPGYISTAPGAARQFDVASVAGVGTINGDPQSVMGGGGLQVEPYATPRLSVPLEAASFGGRREALFGSSVRTEVVFAARLGLRYRPNRRLSLGGGLGPTMLLGVDGGSLIADPVGIAVDVEAAYGERWNRFGLSAVARPTVVVIGRGAPVIYGQVALAPAFFVRPRLALTGHVFGGPVFGLGGTFATIGGGVGLFAHL